MVNDKTAPLPYPPLFDVVFEADLSTVPVDLVIALAEMSMKSDPTRRENNSKELATDGKITLCTCGRDLAEAHARAASARLQRWAHRSKHAFTSEKPLFFIKVTPNVKNRIS